MRAQFGDAALPWLRTALEKAPSTDVRIRCAEELMRANDPAGIVFALGAFEQEAPEWTRNHPNVPWKPWKPPLT